MKELKVVIVIFVVISGYSLFGQDYSLADSEEWRKENPDDFYEMIQQALKEGEHEKVLEWQEWLLSEDELYWLDEHYWEMYLNQAYIELQRGDTREAFHYFSWARVDAKSDEQSTRNLGLLSLRSAQGAALMGLSFTEANYLIKARRRLKDEPENSYIRALVLMQAAITHANQNFPSMAEDFYALSKEITAEPIVNRLIGPGELNMLEFEYLVASNRLELARKLIPELDGLMESMRYWDLLNYIDVKSQFHQKEGQHELALKMLDRYEQHLSDQLGFMRQFAINKRRAEIYLNQDRFAETAEFIERMSNQAASKEEEYKLYQELIIGLRKLEADLAWRRNDMELALEKMSEAYTWQSAANRGGGPFTAFFDLTGSPESVSWAQTNNAELMELAFNVAVLCHINGDVKQSKKFYKYVIPYLEWIMKKRFQNLTEKERTIALKEFNLKFDHFMSFVVSNYQEDSDLIDGAMVLTLFKKGFQYFSNQRLKASVEASGDPELMRTYSQWNDQKKQLSDWYSYSSKDLKEVGVSLKEQESILEDLEKKLTLLSSQFNKSRIKNVTHRDVKRALKEGEALVEIVRTRYLDKRLTDSVLYMTIIVSPDLKKPEVVVLENGNSIEGRYLQSYRNAIKYKLKDEESYNRFWKPIGEKLEGINKVYFSGDGAYHNISLSGLLNPDSENYLMDELDIQRVISGRELVDGVDETTSEKTAILYGYPQYNSSVASQKSSPEVELDLFLNDTTQRFIRAGEITELPGTLKELSALEGLLSSTHDVMVLKEEEATEAHMKALKSPSILHIATHGYFLENALSSDESKGLIMGVESSKFTQDPMLRSGLLMANAKQAITEGGEGVLTAYEAQGLNLSKTDLVVLSACETGLGEIKNGEGVYGLQRAFRNSGASSLLMSLWTVSDQATQKLMELFYTNWLNNDLSKREALRAAQSKLREEYAHPYYWAAFVLIGD